LVHARANTYRQANAAVYQFRRLADGEVDIEQPRRTRRRSRAFAERNNNIVRYTEFDRGGHFAYTTDPDLVVDDLRDFFASLG
jgi:pimeloyl-ACP methyl ester carboxylesterase